MATTILCSTCQKPLRVADENLGKRLKCPGCGTLLTTAPPPAPSDFLPPVKTAAKKPERAQGAESRNEENKPRAIPQVAAPALAAQRKPEAKAQFVVQPAKSSPTARGSRRSAPSLPLVVVGGGAVTALLLVGAVGAAAIYLFSAPAEETDQLVAQQDSAAPPKSSTASDEPLPSSNFDSIGELSEALQSSNTPQPEDTAHKSPRKNPVNPPLPTSPDISLPPVPDPVSDTEQDELVVPGTGGITPPVAQPTSPLPSEPVVVIDIPQTVDPQPPVPQPKDPPADVATVGHPLAGQTATLLHIVRGEQQLLKYIRIAAIDAGKQPGAVTGVQFRMADEPESKKARKLPIDQIVRVVAGDRPYEVRFDRKAGVYSLVDSIERRAAVGEELRKQGEQLWQPLTSEEQERYVAAHREFLTDASKKFGGRLQSIESEYFIFCSDLPAVEAQLSLTYLTTMYTKLCDLFGVTPGENIWLGKCVVIAFRQETDYHAFEQQVMGNPQSEGTAGLHHGYSDGRTIISVLRGGDGAFYRAVLIHETVHGFLHRYQSSVNIPSWINEGVADWVANVVVPDSKEIGMRRALARHELAKTRTLGDEFFRVARITSTQYGTASDMTDFMLQSNPSGYRFFLEGIKEGQTWEASLQDSFGISQEHLAAAYFQQRVGR